MESSRQAMAAFLKQAARAQHDRIVVGGRGLRDWCHALTRLSAFPPARDAVEALGGEPLTAYVLYNTGVGGLLADRDPIDIELVADQLLAHLTRESVEHWQAVAVNLGEVPADVYLDEWRLWTPTSQDLPSFAPVPLAWKHQPYPQWPPNATSHRYLLRRVETSPASRPGVALVKLRPEREAWLALFVLSAFTRARIRAPQLLDVWTDGDSHRWGEEIPIQVLPVEPDEPEGETFERPEGDAPDIADGEALKRFSKAVFSRYYELEENLPKKDGANVQARFQRAASQLATANTDSELFAVYDPSTRNDIILRYVVALETVLSDEKEGLTRTIAQRAAILLAPPGQEAREVHKQVRSAYKARSEYVHGDDPKEQIYLWRFHEVVVQILLHWLVATHARTITHSKKDKRPDTTLLNALDTAILDPSARDDAVTRPLSRFHEQASVDDDPYPPPDAG